ncbi:MAG TPA: iron donor protein CyaY [Polyangiaceae bacterium]|nr:iron donor protein CyaY [Polyangiaceae bacterium]
MIDEREYDERAQPELRALIEALDALEADDFDAELSADILAIEFPDGGKYVVNSHRAARQIWMAAERSAWHFDYDASSGQWRAGKTGDELWSTLARALGKKLGRAISLQK